MQSDLFRHFALPWILRVEGAFNDVAGDRGGATNLGISLEFLRSLPDHDGDGFLDGDIDHDGDVDATDIRGMTEEAAGKAYHDYFWIPGRCDEMPAVVALCLFDGLVNHRPKTARMLVQRALRIAPDGAIGPGTLAAAAKAEPHDFLADYLSYRAQFYGDLVRAHPDQAKFQRGWYRRLFLLQQYVLEAVS